LQKEKIRLDALLVERGLCDDLQRAISLILSGSVIVNGEKITKAGFKYSKDAKLEVLDRIPEYVSRGAFKLKNQHSKHLKLILLEESVLILEHPQAVLQKFYFSVVPRKYMHSMLAMGKWRVGYKITIE
jgi:ribosomal protein S4